MLLCIPWEGSAERRAGSCARCRPSALPGWPEQALPSQAKSRMRLLNWSPERRRAQAWISWSATLPTAYASILDISTEQLDRTMKVNSSAAALEAWFSDHRHAVRASVRSFSDLYDYALQRDASFTTGQVYGAAGDRSRFGRLRSSWAGKPAYQKLQTSRHIGLSTTN